MTVIVCFFCFFSFAQQNIQLTEVSISAPKFQEKMSRTGKVISIIDSAQIVQAKGKGIVELLQAQVGIQTVGARSAWGANQELYMRGSNTGQVLILMDGFPLNDPSHISQVFDWNVLDLSQIQRIEVMKGGQSTIYGSDAMAGVINLVTNFQSTKKMEANASISGGNFGYFAPTFSIRKKIKSTSLGLSGSLARATGFSAADVINGEVDSFKRKQLRFALTSKLNANWELKANANWSDYVGSLDAGPFTDDFDYVSKVHAFSVNGQLKYTISKADVFVRYFSDFSNRKFVDDSTYVPQNAYTTYYDAKYTGRSQGVEVYGKSTLFRQIQAVYGSEYRWQHAGQTDYYYGDGYGFSSPEIVPEKANQSIIAGFLTVQEDWKQGGIELGGRINDQSTFGRFWTYSVNPYLRLNSQWKVFGNLYTGFKVPSLYQLYSAYGNVDLLPEKSNTTDLGIQYKNTAHFLRLVWFDHRVSDGIGFQSKNAAPYGQYYNIASQKSAGLEVDGYTFIGKTKISGNYAFLQGSSELAVNGVKQTKDFLVRRPSHQLAFQASIPFHKQFLGNISYQFVGQRTDLVYDDATFSTVQKELASYHWVDVSLNFQVNSKIRIYGMIKNALNQMIVEQYGYKGMPVVISGGVELVIE